MEWNPIVPSSDGPLLVLILAIVLVSWFLFKKSKEQKKEDKLGKLVKQRTDAFDFSIRDSSHSRKVMTKEKP